MKPPLPPTPRGWIAPDLGRVNCHACGRLNQPGCSRCGFCTNDCSCLHCRTCATVHPRNVCRSCGGCRIAGCRCRGRAGAIDVERYLINPSDGGHVGSLSSVGRAVTLELELSNYSPDYHGHKFLTTHTRHVHDGSIRNAENPTELVVGPIPGCRFEGAMEEIGKWLVDADAEVNETCGFHVHVDARDLGGWEIRRLVRLYHVLEQRFYSLCADGRADGKYATRYSTQWWKGLLRVCKDSTSRSIRETLLLGLYYSDVNQDYLTTTQRQNYLDSCRTMAKKAGNNGREIARYKGMNLHSYFYRGTMEFRMCEGLVDIHRIRRWALWCKWVVELAARLQDREVDQIHTPEDLILGSWSRQYGQLQLPRELQTWAARGVWDGKRVERVAPTPRVAAQG